MLTKDILIANTALASLTEEQIAAITTLSQNDENSVIAKRIGEIYGALDNDILDSAGIQKNGTEKTYDYLKRVLSELKGKISDTNTIKKQVEDLTKEKSRLEKAIAEGAGNAEISKVLKQTKADLQNVTNLYTELNKRFDEEREKYKKDLFNVKIESTLQNAYSGIKIKSELPESVKKVILQQVTDKIKLMNPDYIDDGNNGEKLVFKGENGEILRNPNNQLNPYTVSDMYNKELEALGVLEKPGTKTGTGTNTPNNNGHVFALDISGVKTRVEAFEAIKSSLLAKGLTVGSEKFENEMSQAWKDNNIASLPEK
jgi:hypothetical protein